MGNCSSAPQTVVIRKSQAYNRGEDTRRMPHGAIQSTRTKSGKAKVLDNVDEKPKEEEEVIVKRKASIKPLNMSDVSVIDNRQIEVESVKYLASPPGKLKFGLNNLSEQRAYAVAARELLSIDADAYKKWDEHRFPWACEYAQKPEIEDSSEDLSCYLRCFKFLSGTEARAYELFKAGDIAAASALLPLQPNPVGASPCNSDIGPEDSLACTGTFKDLFTSTSGANKPIARHETIVNPYVNPGEYEDVVHQKSLEETDFLMSRLKACSLFQHIIRKSELRRIAMAMRRVHIEPDVEIFTRNLIPFQGWAGFYILSSGRVNCGSNYGVQKGIGEFFGEQSAMCSQSRARQTIKTMTEVEAFLLDPEDYSGVMCNIAHEKREKYKGWLSNISYLRALPLCALLQLADALEERKYCDGERIVEFGEVGENIHFVVDGTVDVVGREQKDGKLHAQNKKYICSFNEGHPLGYIEFFDVDCPLNIADVVARGPVLTATIGRNHFETCLGPVRDFLKELTEAPEYEYYRNAKKAQATPQKGRYSSYM